MLIPGFATTEGTARYRERHAGRLPGHYRQAQQLAVASIGLGTYLGEPTDKVDDGYRESIVHAAESGINIFDTAINYRHMRSERAVARAVAALIAAGTLRRDEVFLATKGGFLSFDGEARKDASVYFQQELIETGIVQPEEVVAGCHVMSPRYLAYQIDVSRRNLGVETIDLYYLHNPETQLSEISREEFFRRLRAAFAALEQAVAERKIRIYGAATWNAFRLSADSPEALSLEEMLRTAEEVGGKDHHFRAVQLPFNIAMTEALTANAQSMDGRPVPFLHLARERNLAVFASASLLQGRLIHGLPEGLQRHFPGLRTDSQRALQFVRSTPGITCALVGVCQRTHLDENIGTATVPPLTLTEYREIFRKG